MHKILLKCENYWAALLVMLFFISEAFFKILGFEFNTYTPIPKGIKAVFFAFMIAYLIYKKSKSIIPIFLIFLIFCLGQFTIANNFNQLVLIDLSKYLYFLIIIVFFEEVKLNLEQKEKLFKIYEAILVFNFLFIILGLIFKFKFCQSYFYPRFGYNGLLVTSATASYFYSLALIYLNRKYDNIFNTFLFYIVFISALLVGTKMLYLFVICYVFIQLVQKLTKYKYSLYTVFTILTIIGNYILFFKIDMFNKIREKDGIISAISSFRDQLFLNKTLPYIKSNWSELNYFIGGLNDLNLRSQVTIIDMILLFGIIGLILYSFILFKTLGNLLKFKNYYLIILIILITFVGNFFNFSSIAIYVIISNQIFKQQYEISNKYKT